MAKTIKERIIEEQAPELIKIKKYKDTNKVSLTLLGKNSWQKTWSVLISRQSEEFMKEYIKAWLGIPYEEVPSESYIWGKRKNGKFGWIKV